MWGKTGVSEKRSIDCDFSNPDFGVLTQSFGVNHYRIENGPGSTPCSPTPTSPAASISSQFCSTGTPSPATGPLANPDGQIAAQRAVMTQLK
jgi:hypothetical protein